MATFDFFRRNQKLILYTAGIFALLTFSISGAMMSFFGDLTGPGFKGATLQLAGGRKVYTTREDHQIAQGLVNSRLVPDLIPEIGGEKTTDGDRIEILSALRRLAIEYGIDASRTEVDKAVQTVVDVWPKREGQPPLDAARLAASSGLSGDQYDLLLRESLRISTFLRLFGFAADTSDAELAAKLARDIKLLTLEVATLDKKRIEEQLKETPVGDEDLQKWLAELPEAEKAPYQDSNRVGVKAFGVKLAEFDASAFAEELKDKTYDDAAIEARYNLDRELLYRKDVKEGEDPPAEPYQPFAEVKEAVLQRMKAEDALGAVVEKLRNRMGEKLQPLIDARTEASKTVARAKAEQAEADQKLAEKPDDEALKAAAAAAKAAVETAEGALAEAGNAVDAARRAFDVETELPEVTKAKLTVATISEPKNADGLKDLPEFGPWDSSWTATSIDLPGDLGSRIQNTKAGVFFFQVLDVVKSPLKEFTAIADKLREDYYRKKADEQAKTKLTAFEDALKRLAREQKKAEIDALEAEHSAAVTRKFDEWKAKTEADLAKAREMVQSLSANQASVSYKRWKDKLDSLQAALDGAEAKRTALEAEIRKETDGKIDDVVKKARAGVLETAAAEAGLTVETIGPYRKDASSQPRFYQDTPERMRFLFGNQAVTSLKEGEASDVLEDFTNRAHHVVVMEKVAPGTVADVTRRELLRQRETFASERMQSAVAQSFTVEALEKGWGYQRTDAATDKARAQKSTAGGDKGAKAESGAEKGTGGTGGAPAATGGSNGGGDANGGNAGANPPGGGNAEGKKPPDDGK